MKVIIHSCTDRLEYVNKYLVPSLQQQKIEDITIYNDKYKIGNLLSFVLSCKNAPDAWHLQDDVVICRDFAKRIKNLDGLVCGFSVKEFEPLEYIEGKTTAEHIGFSFPCIRIPGEIAQHFYKWFYEDETQSKYKDVIASGKMDDLLFRSFLMEEYNEMEVLNLQPSLVDHIDYLLGGSQTNKAREGRRKQVRATRFDDLDLVKYLESALINYGKEDKTT